MAFAKKAKKTGGVTKPVKKAAKKKAFNDDRVRDRPTEGDEDPEPRPWEGKTKF